MRKVIIMFALAMGIATANAQENVTVGKDNGSEQPTLTKEVYPQKEADGDLYHGLTKKLTFDRMVPPHGLEVTYDKTVHVIFPSEVRYVDLGSPDLIAGKADGAENVIRVKATVRDFPNETNMSVITEDGSFYAFNVKYAAEPLLLNVEMCDFIHDGEAVNRPNNAQEIYLKELGSESPMLVRLIMKSILGQNKREVKHIGCKRFGIQYLLKGIYTHNGLLYFHTEIKNQSNVPFDVDYITWKIVDKKVAKRTAVQEQIILPLRAQNYATLVPYHQRTSSALTMRKHIAIIIASLALFTGQAHAQRCLPKMQGIEVRANMADGFNPGGNDGGYSFGAALSTYTKGGNKWVFGGEYLLKNNPYKDGKIPVAQFTAEGGYYFKILSDARKIVFVYAGASALAGYESVNWGEKVLHDGSTLHDRDSFIYGGALTLDVEFYVADRIALLANLRERCLWGGDTRKFHTQWGVGVKFIIN